MRTPFFWVMILHHATLEESTHCSKTNSNFHTQASNEIIKYVITAMIRTPHTLHTTYFPRNKCLYKINANTKICQYVVMFHQNILKPSSTTIPPKCYSVAKQVTGSDLGLFLLRHGICHFVLYHSHGFRNACVQVRQ